MAERLMNRIVLALLLAVLGLSLSASAQTSPSTGAITGTVTDSSGAVVSNATVKLSNANFGVSRETKTHSDGTFVFPLLQPASGYSVTVEREGFQKAVITDVAVLVTQVTSAPVKLQVGAVTQEVVVSGVSEVVQTSNATLGSTMTAEVVSSIPLATRNTFELLATDAGVASNLTSPSATILQGSVAMFVTGSRDTANNYVLNGIDANNFEFHTLALGVVPIPNPDAVQEFRTQTSLYDATSGFSGGGNVNLITRGGTSKFHGNAYEYLRNQIFNANDFFLNRAGKPKPIMKQNQFGGSLGGPIGRSNTRFFFANYEGMRQSNGVAGFGSGFYPVLPSNRDAASLAAAFGVPVGSIDPVALKILQKSGPYDGYLVPSGTGAPVGQLGTWTYSAPVRYSGDQVNSRYDDQFKTWGVPNSVSVSYFWSKGLFNNMSGANGSAGQPYTYPLRNDSLSIRDTQTIRNNLLNEFAIGFTYNRRDIFSENPINPSDVGMTRFNSSYVPSLPNFYIDDGTSSFAGATASVEQRQHNFSSDINDMINWVSGKHNIRIGGQYRTYQFNFTPSPDRGTLEFDTFTDFLTGSYYYSAISSGIQNFYFRARDISGFIQDDFRVTSRLTLNLGLRWDYFGNTVEKNNHMSNFDPSRVDPYTALYGGAGYQNAFILPAALGADGTPNISRSTLDDQGKSNFAPRIGFAWDVLGNGKLAVRSGFGMYYMRIAGMQSMQTISNPPFATSAATYFAPTNMADPFAHLPQPNQYPIWPTWPSLTSLAPDGTPSFSADQFYVTSLDKGLKPPYKESWNLAVQYEFLKGWTVELGYAGSHGVRLQNALSPNSSVLHNENNPGPFGLVTNDPTNRDARVPFVGIANGGIYYLTNNGSSVYHAGLLTVNHQFSKRLFFKAAYTYSKSLDDSISTTGFEPGAGNPGNPFLNSLNRGLSAYDMTHRLVVTYMYNLPGPTNHWSKPIIGGWSVAGLTTYQSGLPGYISQSVYSTSLSGISGYGDIIAGCKLTNGLDTSASTIQYLNPACVSRTPLVTGTIGPYSPFYGPGNQMYEITPGSSGRLIGPPNRGAWRAPFQQRWDMALIKSIPVRQLGETGNLQFRADFFKLFNTPIFAGPSSTASLSSFGKITKTIDNTGRQIQFALRLNF